MSNPWRPKERIAALAVGTAILTTSALRLAAWTCACVFDDHHIHPGQIYWAGIHGDFEQRLSAIHTFAMLGCAVAAFVIHGRRWRVFLVLCFAVGLTIPVLIFLGPTFYRE
jgi:hypothetical protein